MFSVLLGASLANAQGGSAIITLMMPPPGGEGYSMLQDGGLFADGAVSSYYNPALLADLERNTGSQIHYANSNQDLLTGPPESDWDHKFDGLAAVLPDSGKGADFGLGISRNHVSFGESALWDPEGNLLGTSENSETVWGMAAGVRLGLPVSLGIGAKYFRSRLFGYVAAEGERREARGWAFDVGILANPRLSPAASTGLPWFEITPSMSAVLRNMGPKALYSGAERADPLPRTFAFGMGLKVSFIDLVDFETAATQDRAFPRQEDWSIEPAYQQGYSAAILCFRISRGWLDDDAGKRWESHDGQAVELDMLRIYRIWNRFTTGDFRSPPAAMEKGYPLARTRILGVPFRANPRLIFGRRSIESRDDGVRDGQSAAFIAFSL